MGEFLYSHLDFGDNLDSGCQKTLLLMSNQTVPCWLYFT